MTKNILQFGLWAFLLVLALPGQAQRVVYSLPDRTEGRQVNFEIIGKYNDNVLIYKQPTQRGNHYISVYNAAMEVKENIALPFMPDRVIKTEFLPFNDFAYMFYQYQKRNVVYGMMVKIGQDGKPLSQPIELDTTQVSFGSQGRVYSLLRSEDRQRLMVFKINNRNEQNYIFKTQLYDQQLNLLHTTLRLGLPMRYKDDMLTDFYLDNEGHLVFGRGERQGVNDNITRFDLVVKPATADSFTYHELPLKDLTLDAVKMHMDNYNQRYLLTGFYYKGRRSYNIEGLNNAIFDKKSSSWVVSNIIPYSEEIRADAKGENNMKTALNDFFIRDVLVQRDGGFLTISESIYQTSRGNYPGMNRWDYYGYPYGNVMFDYYMMRSPYMSPYGSGRYGNTRYHADNVLISSFDNEGKLNYTNVIRKTQFDDEVEGMVGYGLVNTGGDLKFVYNNYDRRDVILTQQIMDPQGKISRPPTLKNLERGYSFLPKYGKQVSAKTYILPCLYRNSLCFARIEFE